MSSDFLDPDTGATALLVLWHVSFVGESDFGGGATGEMKRFPTFDPRVAGIARRVVACDQTGAAVSAVGSLEIARFPDAGSALSFLRCPIRSCGRQLVVVLGSFHRVERALLFVSATLCLYLIDGVLAKPNWSLILRHSNLPHMPADSIVWVARPRNSRHNTCTLGSGLYPVVCRRQQDHNRQSALGAH